MSVEPLFVRLYLDENVFPELADVVRQRGFDCTSAAEAGMLSRSDEEQLTYAAEHDRCLMSFDMADFVVLGSAWWDLGKTHEGILLAKPVPRRHFGHLLRRTLRFLNETTADEMRNQIRYL